MELRRPCCESRPMARFTGVEMTEKYRALSRGLMLGNAVLRWQLEHAVAPNAFALVEHSHVAAFSGCPRRVLGERRPPGGGRRQGPAVVLACRLSPIA